MDILQESLKYIITLVIGWGWSAIRDGFKDIAKLREEIREKTCSLGKDIDAAHGRIRELEAQNATLSAEVLDLSDRLNYLEEIE